MRTLFLVTFDEVWALASATNPLYSVLWANYGGQPAGTDNTEYSHYSLLATMEENWPQMGNLGKKDLKAKPFAFKVPH